MLPKPSPSAAGRWPLAEVQWPEPTRHGQRTLHFKDGGSLQVAGAAAFDAWRALHGPPEGWVVRAQQHWRGTLVALVMLVAVGAAGYRWGVPAAARGLVALVPVAADQAVGAQALESVQGRWLKPTQLPVVRQQALRSAFAQMVAQAWPAAGPTQSSTIRAPAYTLRFHAATRPRVRWGRTPSRCRAATSSSPTSGWRCWTGTTTRCWA